VQKSGTIDEVWRVERLGAPAARVAIESETRVLRIAIVSVDRQLGKFKKAIGFMIRV
jgi:hypothetical protein